MGFPIGDLLRLRYLFLAVTQVCASSLNIIIETLPAKGQNKEGLIWNHRFAFQSILVFKRYSI